MKRKSPLVYVETNAAWMSILVAVVSLACVTTALEAGPSAPNLILYSKPAGAITIDGDPSDWDLADFTTYIRGGGSGAGDKAFIGYDDMAGTVYCGGYCPEGVPPTSGADHNATVYNRHDEDYQYFLVRIEDDDIKRQHGTGMNWANDCVEFYVDPGHDGGSGRLGDNEMSDFQLVIDAFNQVNVYHAASPTYRSAILAGVDSVAVTDTTGWTLEVRILKSVANPDLPASGMFGLDFQFRDNDNQNDPSTTTVYSWRDTYPNGECPSKRPDYWGDVCNCFLTPVTLSFGPGNPIEVDPGSSDNILNVDLENSMDVRALHLTVTDNPDNLTFTNAAVTARCSTYLASFMDRGTETGIVLVSVGEDTIAPGTGAVVDLTFDVAPGPHTTDIDFTEVQAADENSNKLTVITVANQIVAGAVCTPGDMEPDGDWDLFDILRLVDVVLDVPPPPSPYEICAGDMDEDGDHDLFDILALVDKVLEE